MGTKVKKREYRRGNGSLFRRGRIWWVKFYRDGRSYRESSRSEDEGIAEKLLTKRIGEIAADNFLSPKLRRIRFEDLAADLETDYKMNNRRSAPRLARSIGHLKKFFSGWRAANITTDQIRLYVLRRQAESAANGSINRELAALKRMFSLARRNYPPKITQAPYVPMLKEAAPRKGFLEHPDFLRLRDALLPYLKPLAAMAYQTGMRMGEILSLRWDQVDFALRQIRLDPGTTKNDAARTVPFIGDLDERLRVLKQDRDRHYPECTWVFSRGGQPIRSFRNSWQSACKRVGLDGLLFHDLRRSGVRNLVRAGVPEVVAMAISGHKTRAIFDRYNITNERDLTDAARKLDAYLQDGHNSGTIQVPDVFPARNTNGVSRIN